MQEEITVAEANALLTRSFDRLAARPAPAVKELEPGKEQCSACGYRGHAFYQGPVRVVILTTGETVGRLGPGHPCYEAYVAAHPNIEEEVAQHDEPDSDSPVPDEPRLVSDRDRAREVLRREKGGRSRVDRGRAA